MKIRNSKRLSYRLLNRDDADLLFQLDQDEEVMRFINGGKKTSMKEIHEVFIPRMENYTNEDKGWGLWKVTIEETDEYIGWVLVRPMDFYTESPTFDNLELGWRFMRKSWGKGYGTEAAKIFRDVLNENVKINKLSAIALETNHASINIMKKIGMTHLNTSLHKTSIGDAMVAIYEMDV